jgi:hypothetical protein
MPTAQKRPTRSPITFEDMRLVYRNFAGREGLYNKSGDQSFSILLPWEIADAMANDGYNVKFPKDIEDKEILPHIQVKVNFDGDRPPQVIQITSRGKTHLTKETSAVLDYADIKHVDLIVNPYFWEVKSDSGWSLYLKSIYVTIEEDPLELKYSDIVDVAGRAPDEE